MSNSADTRRYGSLLFIGLLAVLFALQWGPGAQGCETRIIDEEHAATVNGRPIPLKEFARSYVQQAENFRRQGVPSDLMKQFGIHKQVMDQLVNTELLAQAAEAKGLVASNEDLRKVLSEVPSFQKDGKFNRDSYQQYVRDYEGTTEVFFEDKLRRQLSAQRLLELVEASVTVSDEEVKAKYWKEGDTAKVTYVRFSPTMYGDKVPAPKPADVVAWAKANEAAIAGYYEQNKFTYFLPEKVKARQVLLKVEPGADDARKAEVKQRIENLRKELVDNKKDFAELAKQFSEDLETKEKGGDLGFVERLQLPNAFADLLFALQPGEVTAPVETPMGWFLGTVSEKQAPVQRPLDQVRQEIAAQLLVKEKARALAKADADKALAALGTGKTLTELFPPEKSDSGANPFAFAAETAPTAKETGEFNASADGVPQIGEAAELKKQIFALTAPATLPQVTELPDGFVVAVVDERKVPSDANFEQQKAQLKLEAVKGKQFEVREGYLKALKQSGTVVTNDSAIDKIVGDS